MDVRSWWRERSTVEKVVVGVGAIGGLFLLLAALVVVVAVVGAFAVDLGAEETSTPQVVLEGESDDGTVTITHQGGDPIPVEDLVVEVDGDPVDWSGPEEAYDDGDEIAVEDVDPGATVELYWVPSETERVLLIEVSA